MKLAAIYNVWDGVELLKGSMECLKNDVDLFVIVWQEISNFGEAYNPIPDMNLAGYPFVLVKYIPSINGGQRNEIEKRNLGLSYAKQFGCTHFLHLDTDEYYEDFSAAKIKYIESGAKGSVCNILTYFKEPTLRLDSIDGYSVPFIHELLPDTMAGGRNYPFYVDRTRQINCDNVVLLPVIMHHFSWIRVNIERKIMNSSARNNILKGTLPYFYKKNDLKPGDYIKDFEKKLVQVENIFNISI